MTSWFTDEVGLLVRTKGRFGQELDNQSWMDCLLGLLIPLWAGAQESPHCSGTATTVCLGGLHMDPIVTLSLGWREDVQKTNNDYNVSMVPHAISNGFYPLTVPSNSLRKTKLFKLWAEFWVLNKRPYNSHQSLSLSPSICFFPEDPLFSFLFSHTKFQLFWQKRA